jgi:hypothetical protein
MRQCWRDWHVPRSEIKYNIGQTDWSERALHRPVSDERKLVVSMPRRRVKHKASFEDRLTDEARRFKEQAEELPPGPQRDDLKRKARDAEAAAHISRWLAQSA